MCDIGSSMFLQCFLAQPILPDIGGMFLANGGCLSLLSISATQVVHMSLGSK